MQVMNQPIAAIVVSNLSVYYHAICALESISVSIASGTLLAIVGPNGGGKTTFLKALLDLTPCKAEKILFFGKPFAQIRSRVAYIPQRMTIDWDFPATVFDVVMMGRYSHMGWFGRPSSIDYDKVYEALDLLGLSSFADRHIAELSGGQQQRLFVARALVQDADILLFDEPFVGIDIKTEQLIIKLLQELKSRGKTIVVVHHDLHTLSEYFDSVLLLNVKKIAFGSINAICVPEYICATYGDRNLYAPHQKDV